MTLADLAVNAAKVEEFKRIAESAQMLILQGPTGCGKNAMIKAYCAERGMKLERF
jgi:HrpA-like RNA helicase